MEVDPIDFFYRYRFNLFIFLYTVYGIIARDLPLLLYLIASRIIVEDASNGIKGMNSTLRNVSIVSSLAPRSMKMADTLFISSLKSQTLFRMLSSSF